MNKIVYFFATIMFMYSTGTIFSQQKKANISFSETSHDFGTLKEDGGKVTYEFKFNNIGGDTLKLLNVKASCGCTTPEWSQEPILPGKSGFVKATYDPMNRVGNFNKTITVTTNSENPNQVLTIIGIVTPREKTIADIYAFKKDSLRLKKDYVQFANIKNTEVRTDSLEVINTATYPLKVTFKNYPSYVNIKTVPETLKPNEKGHIVTTFDAKSVNDWGNINQRVYIVFNDKDDNNNAINVSAVVEEDFSKLSSKEIEMAPVIAFDNTTHDFDTITSGDKKEFEYTFTNKGKSDLIIRKVKAGCGCTISKSPKDTIKPGESSFISATFNSRGKHGNEHKTITVISNDPKNNSVILIIKGFIKDAPTTTDTNKPIDNNKSVTNTGKNQNNTTKPNNTKTNTNAQQNKKK